MQDTGFSAHLPVGAGLLAVRNAQEAADAIEAVEGDYSAHSSAARRLARECLDVAPVVGGLLKQVGLASPGRTSSS